MLEILLEDGVECVAGDAQREHDLRAGALSGDALLALAAPEARGDEDSSDKNSSQGAAPVQEKSWSGFAVRFLICHAGKHFFSEVTGGGADSEAFAQVAFQVIELVVVI